MREDVGPAVVNVSFTINISVVSTLLVKELVSIGAVASVVIIVVDGVSNISVVIISVVSLGKLLVVTSNVAVDISFVLVLVTMVTGCTDAELVCTDDNSDDGSSMERS